MAKLPTINIKGKEYVLVKDRVEEFNNLHPNGSINTKIVKFDGQTVIIRATVVPDVEKPDRKFTDYAAEIVGGEGVNKTSAIENCSTSAVGRALAYMGIGLVDSIASADEMVRAGQGNDGRLATEKQKATLVKMFKGFSNGNITTDESAVWAIEAASKYMLDELPMQEASALIGEIGKTKKLPLDFDEETPDMEPEERDEKN